MRGAVGRVNLRLVGRMRRCEVYVIWGGIDTYCGACLRGGLSLL